MLYACSLLLVVGAVVIMYLYVGKWLPVVIVIGCGAGMIGIMRLLQRNDDVYISQIVAALSDLLDSLSELERQEVFPEMKIHCYPNYSVRPIRWLPLLDFKMSGNGQNMKISKVWYRIFPIS